MTTVRHVARVVGVTTSAAPAYRVELRAGAHHLVADEPVAGGGGDVGPSPFGLLLSGLAACTATTLRMYAARKSWELTSIEADVRYDAGDHRHRPIQRTITAPTHLSAHRREPPAAIAERTPAHAAT